MIRKLLFGVFVFGLFGLAYYNFKTNTLFLIAPAYTILNLLVAVVFAYYLAQRKNDERKLKEKAEDLIDKIQIAINDERSYRVTTKQDVDCLKIRQRTISNQIDILFSLKDKLSCTGNIEYIKEKYIEYKELTGNHIEDLEYLTKSEKDLLNKILLIDNKLDEMKMDLYK